MTSPLYLEDSYMKECDATVVEVIDGKSIVLDQTIFYPRGGGQPGDTGKMIASGREFRVLNVAKREGKIIHELDQEAGLKAQDTIHCVLDWDRRYRLMRMHTAAHLLAATMNKELGVLITGNELGEDKTRFDFNMSRSSDLEHARDRSAGRGMENFDRDLFEEIVKKANESLKQDLELKTYTLPREEAMKIPGVVKLAGALPPNITELRIVEIPNLDIQADGGTHVKNLKEAGQIELLKLENKGKNNRRIYFRLIP